MLFIGVCKIQTPQLIRELSVIDSSNKEFSSQHSLQWKFVFLDERATSIIGYLPFEVLGTSGYDYYHPDDLEKVVKSHKSRKSVKTIGSFIWFPTFVFRFEVIEKGQGTSCFYRFLTKGQQWIWLQSSFYIRYNQWNSKPEIVICTHRILNYADVINELRKTLQANDEPVNICISHVSKAPKTQKITSDTLIEKPLPTTTTIDKPPYSPINFLMTKFGSSTTPGSPNVQSKHQPSSYDESMSDPSSFANSKHAHKRNYRAVRSTHQLNFMLKWFYVVTFVLQRSKRQSHSPMPRSNSSQTNTQTSVLLQHHRDPQQYVETFQPISLAPATNVNHPTFQDGQQHFPLMSQIIPPILTEANLPCLTATQIQSAVVLAQPATSLAYTNIVMTSTQTHMQDQLQRKHEELQQLIAHQQEELRRVSEQLLMARYGLLPPSQAANNVAILNTTDGSIHDQPLIPPSICYPQLTNPMETESSTSPCNTSVRQASNVEICTSSGEVLSYIDLGSSATVGLDCAMHSYQQQSQESASDHHPIHLLPHVQHQQLSTDAGMQPDRTMTESSVYTQQMGDAMDTSAPYNSSGREMGNSGSTNFMCELGKGMCVGGDCDQYVRDIHFFQFTLFRSTSL